MSSLQEQLRVLSIFHYVVGGLHALAGSMGLIHFTMGLFLIFAPSVFGSSAHGPQAEPPVFIGIFFALIGGLFVVAGWTLGVLTILSGRFITQRKKRMFSLVIGCINCVLVPFGTVLGVFDIVLLTRDDVRVLYGEPPSL